ncbi:retrotransposon unclassified [Moniliophthora roreri MCA 2997]|uniref:Retrotransposon unclassified n=1 Tax=Moniliophthora roreri (strain MCA 2997) TaxID=1381753 RepID=V2XP00_MONRO|nr:retrotransposon unclassified [Moniliophthora roreri MCA 2997]
MVAQTPSKVPKEVWSGQQQTAQYLVSFSSIRFAHILKETGRGKLDSQSEKVMMVGYNGNSVYLAKLWGSDKVKRVRDVEDLSFLELNNDKPVDRELEPLTPISLTVRQLEPVPETTKPLTDDSSTSTKQPQQTRCTQEEIWRSEVTRHTTRDAVPSRRVLDAMHSKLPPVQSPTMTGCLRHMTKQRPGLIYYPFEININNTSAIALSDKTTKHGRTKHFDMNWSWLQDMIQAKELTYSYIPLNDNLADLFTKQLTCFKTEWFTFEIGLQDN